MCGKNIIISNSKKTAKRVEKSFCDAIVFTNRPIGVYERIYVKINSLSSIWNGMLRFGFTTINPDLHRKCLITKGQKSEITDSLLNQEEISDDDYLYDLPKYVYPDLTNKKGYWAGAIPQNLVKENDVLYFYVNSNGEIHYGINNTYKGQFLDGIDVYSRPQNPQSLWGMFDIYGNTLSIELINNVNDSNNNNIQTHNPDYESVDNVSLLSNNLRTLALDSVSSTGSSSISSSNSSSMNFVTIIPNNQVTMRKNRKKSQDTFSPLLISHRSLCVDNHLNETLRDSFVEDSESQKFNELNSKIKNFYELVPVLMHEKVDSKDSHRFIRKIHGKNVHILEPDCSIAYRESSIRQIKNVNNKEPTRNAYVFLDAPVEIGKSFCLQLVGIDQSLNESKISLGIGCTTCNPNHLKPEKDLPNDADCLLDRPEYWVVFQNLFNSDIVSKKHNVSLADELCFIIDENNGNLKFYVNGNLITNCLFNVDTTQKLWFFFDLCGRINAIRLIKPCHKWNRERPNSALIEYYKSQLIAQDSSENKKNSRKDKRNSNLEECRICLDAPIECVFYSCGHMCLCWNWYF